MTAEAYKSNQMLIKGRLSEKLGLLHENGALSRGRANTLLGLGAAATAASHLAEASVEVDNLNAKIDANISTASELEARSDMLLNALAQSGQKAKGKQAAAFAASGVKLEGTALDVQAETIRKFGEAQIAKKREIDWKIRQLEMENAIMQVKSDFAFSKAALNATAEIAGSYASFKMGKIS